MRKTNYNHLLKQFCILLFAFCIFCAFGAVSASAAEASDLTVTIDTGASVTLKDADGDGYYDIGTADELYAFAAAVGGFVSGLIVAFDGDAETAEVVSGLILQGAAVLGYILAEGLTDAAAAK